MNGFSVFKAFTNALCKGRIYNVENVLIENVAQSYCAVAVDTAGNYRAVNKHTYLVTQTVTVCFAVVFVLLSPHKTLCKFQEKLFFDTISF